MQNRPKAGGSSSAKAQVAQSMAGADFVTWRQLPVDL